MSGDIYSPIQQGLGPTVGEIKSKLKNPDDIHAKTKFTMVIPEVEQKLAQLKRDGAVDTIIIAGVETHVCIVATCQDLIQKGYTVRNELNIPNI